MALRRHLSQERLTTPHLEQHTVGPSGSTNAETKHQHQNSHHQHQNSHHQQSRNENARMMLNNGNNSGTNAGPGILGTRTIGDLVSSEIERTLEISNQNVCGPNIDMGSRHMTNNRTDNFSPLGRPTSVEAENTGLATLAHVASYAPTPSSSKNSAQSSAPTSRSSVLYNPQQQNQQSQR